jgi:hypothetical protein
VYAQSQEERLVHKRLDLVGATRTTRGCLSDAEMGGNRSQWQS